MIHSKFFLFTLLCELVVGSALASSIETPEKKISLRFSTLFNFINFSAKDSYFKNCNLNQPIDIGIGGGFGDFFWDFTYALPFSIDDKSSPSETSVVDNLLKGASGQAVQNMNLMFDLDEMAGLRLKANYF